MAVNFTSHFCLRPGTVRARLADQGRGGAEGWQFKDEIVAVTIKGKKGDTIVDQDEYILMAPSSTP